MGGRGASSSSGGILGLTNRILSKADTKGAVRFSLEGNGTLFRMTKNNGTYTIKAGNRVYAKNVSASEARKVIKDTQDRFNRMNESFRRRK